MVRATRTLIIITIMLLFILLFTTLSAGAQGEDPFIQPVPPPTTSPEQPAQPPQAQPGPPQGVPPNMPYWQLPSSRRIPKRRITGGPIRTAGTRFPFLATRMVGGTRVLHRLWPEPGPAIRLGQSLLLGLSIWF